MVKKIMEIKKSDMSVPISSKARARAREKEMMKQMDALMKCRDEATLTAMLLNDYQVDKEDPRYLKILRIWRSSQ